MTILCALADIPDPGAKEFTAEVDGQTVSIFVVHRNGEVFGYVNSCPHVGAPLNWEVDKFLDLGGEEILCHMHGARFSIETGACLMGPCRQKRLRPYPVAVSHGNVVKDSCPDGI